MNNLPPNLRRRTLFLFIGGLLLFLVATDVTLIRHQYDSAVRHRVQYVTQMLEMVGQFAVESLLKRDYQNLEQYLQRWAQAQDNIIKLDAVAPNGFKLATFHRNEVDESLQSVSMTWTVIHEGRTLMEISIVESLAQIREEIVEFVWRLVGSSLVVVGLLGWAIWWVFRRFTIVPMEQDREQLQDDKAEVEESLRRVRFSVDHTSDLLLWLDEEGMLFDFNQQTMEILARSEDELRGAPLWQVDTTITADKWGDIWAGASGKGSNYEGKLLSSGGEEIPVDIIAIRQQFNGGEHLFLVMRDARSRKEAESRLRDQLYFTNTLIDTIPSPIFYKDMDGQYLGCNQAFEEMLGLSREKLIGKTVYDISPNDLAESYHKSDMDLIRNGRAQIYESEVVGHDRICRNVIFHKAVFKDSDGKRAGLVGVFVDITELKEYEAELLLSRDKAEVANRAKSEFLAVMSHEIRTPLNAILGVTEILQGTDIDSDQSNFLGVLKRAGNNLLTLIEDILDITQIESGLMTFKNSPINIKELTCDALEVHAQSAGNKGLCLSHHIDPATPEQFYSDPKRIRQILLNLLGNAVKFTEQGDVELQISNHNSQGILFSIRDTGIGISEENRTLIFEPFSQADSSLTRQYGGVGLGLSICKRLVDAMGGRIWVEGGLGKGSIFHFYLTSAANNQHLDQSFLADKIQGESVRTTEGKSSILLAEDDTDNAMVIEAYLNSTLHQVDIVTNGNQAVEKIQSGKQYDLVLMDIQMPVMDGLEATRQIRVWENDHGYSRAPIIALTAHAMTGDKEKSLAAGCDGHITKPITKKKLLEVIDQHTSSVTGQNPPISKRLQYDSLHHKDQKKAHNLK
jgi:PAS domain S-box-containing protein